MYAIEFVLDTDSLIKTQPDKNSWATAYVKIEKFFADNGFYQVQFGLYYAPKTMNVTTLILILQHLNVELGWFKSCVKRASILRIDEVTPVIEIFV